MYKVTVNLPNLAKGADVEIDGLGVFKNGSENVVDDDTAQAFRAHHVTQTTKTNKKGQMEVSVEQGPTVLEAFKGNEHIVVETYEPPKDNKKGDDK